MKANEHLELVYKMPFDKDQIWSLITDIDHMKLWYFDNIPSFEARVGFATEFIVKNESRTFTHQWLVTAVVEHEKITYDWTFKEYKGRSLSTFFIREEAGQMYLNIKISVLENFPKDVPEFDMESCRGGWDWFVGRLQKVELGAIDLK